LYHIGLIQLECAFAIFDTEIPASYFLKTAQAKDMIIELSTGDILPVVSINSGKEKGTYCCKELVFKF